MSSRFKLGMFAIAEGLPGSRLTPEYRACQHYSKDWHRNTDEELDRELDLWYGAHASESAQQLKSLLDHPAAPAAMASVAEAKESPLSSYGSNEFDNPDFQTHPIQNDDPTLEKAHSSSPTEMKQELAATVVLTPATSADELNAHAAPNADDGSQPMQRVFTEPTVHSSTHWQSDNSEGSPFSNTMLYSSHGMHQAASATPEKIWHQRNNPSLRSRFHYDPYQPTYGSVQGGNVGQRQYTPTMGNQRMAQPFHGVPGHYEAGINASTYDQVLGTNPLGDMTNNSHFVNRQNTQHNNNVGSPPVFQDHNDPASGVPRRVSSQDILKSQPLPVSSESRGSAYSVSIQPRGTRRRQSHLDMMNEDADLQARSELMYKDIESARQAERPKFKISGKPDPTIPLSPEDKQRYVVRMVRCMNHSARAEDNPGMVRQWEKLKQDGARVEQAAWRLLDLVLQLHVDGVPLLPNKPSCNRYGSMLERWDKICEGLQTQKTMCKHLLGAEFMAQLVNDPSTATQRVTNNRKVNSAKKSYLDHGRRAVHNDVARVGRRGSSVSTLMRPIDDSDYGDTTFGDPYLGDNPGLYGELGDEDAEGEVDEDYVNTTAAARASATIRRPKRERETEDDEYGVRGKKSRRTSAKDPSDKYPTAPKRHVKNARKKIAGWGSKLQVIDEHMVDLNNKAHEDLVYTRGDDRVKEIFEKLHYPEGRPASRNVGYDHNGQLSPASSSRRVSRAAAPLSFAGQDNSDETEDSYTDDKTAEADEFYQN
ncbi:MAG: hypothetical protein Q9223_002518 [Gallowayella weberi]